MEKNMLHIHMLIPFRNGTINDTLSVCFEAQMKDEDQATSKSKTQKRKQAHV